MPRKLKDAGGGGGAAQAGGNTGSPAPLVACASPDARTTPQFVVYFRQPLALKFVAQYPDPSGAVPGDTKA